MRVFKLLLVLGAFLESLPLRNAHGVWITGNLRSRRAASGEGVVETIAYVEKTGVRHSDAVEGLNNRVLPTT
ncbi:MAG TPA: hypothetical protein VNA88_08705 [Candidatus Kapabacteria bacterium]|jgi:hypothetical protein|nr:hypothetical protein [Candidatus Kapabacteria bacterium]